MGILRGNKTKKREKKPSTAEQRSRNAEYRRKQHVNESLISLMNEDPDVRLQVLAQEFNLTLPTAEIEEERKIKAFLYKLVMDEITHNPVEAKNIAKAMLRNLMLEKGWVGGKEDTEHLVLNPLEKMLEQADTYEELRKRFGGKGSWSAILGDKDVVCGILELIGSVFGDRSGDVQERIMVVKVDGIVKEITSNEYLRLTAEGRTQPLNSSDLLDPGDTDQSKKIASESDGQEKSSDLSAS